MSVSYCAWRLTSRWKFPLAELLPTYLDLPLAEDLETGPSSIPHQYFCTTYLYARGFCHEINVLKNVRVPLQPSCIIKLTPLSVILPLGPLNNVFCINCKGKNGWKDVYIMDNLSFSNRSPSQTLSMIKIYTTGIITENCVTVLWCFVLCFPLTKDSVSMLLSLKVP